MRKEGISSPGKKERKRTRLHVGGLLVLLVWLTACSKYNDVSCRGTLFGQPIAATGLDSLKCKPACDCKHFESKVFTTEQLTSLRNWTPTNPPEELTENPYNDPVPVKPPGVCAIVVDDPDARTYHLENFPDSRTAEMAGAAVTHADACGLCSTLQDFAVYAENLDIGTTVKACGLENFLQPFNVLVDCIQELGFTRPCAQIWAYNTRHTQAKCLDLCLNNDPYNLPDGSLSPCLACDEKMSGPVFKAVAGRTRRNTGIASSICRFCEEVEPVEHNYRY